MSHRESYYPYEADVQSAESKVASRLLPLQKRINGNLPLRPHPSFLDLNIPLMDIAVFINGGKLGLYLMDFSPRVRTR